ncbi:MAG TPA: hypothetical protein VEH80_03195 [Candidatus Bathyarchaeia archaeon]|nr:hypothetical protein [Candidatus Bathyarchaeia archaeon]
MTQEQTTGRIIDGSRSARSPAVLGGHATSSVPSEKTDLGPQFHPTLVITA